MTARTMARPTAARDSRELSGAHAEAQLFARHQRGERAAREALVERFMPLARSLARRYDRSSEPFEDLLQVASLGLLKALDRFDPERGHPFASFAVPTILGEMRRYFRDARLVRARSARLTGTRAEGSRRAGAARERARARADGERTRGVPRARAPRRSSTRCRRSRRTSRSRSTRRARAPTTRRPPMATAMGEEDERYELVELDATVSAVLGRIPAARARDPAHALRRGPHADRDRRARRDLADAGLAPAAPLARAAACADELDGLEGRRRPRLAAADRSDRPDASVACPV